MLSITTFIRMCVYAYTNTQLLFLLQFNWKVALFSLMILCVFVCIHVSGLWLSYPSLLSARPLLLSLVALWPNLYVTTYCCSMVTTGGTNNRSRLIIHGATRLATAMASQANRSAALSSGPRGRATATVCSHHRRGRSSARSLAGNRSTPWHHCTL